MPCDCVKEETTVLQNINKTLRQVNTTLRRKLMETRAENDELFGLLCRDASAEAAMRELWEHGELDCDPEDYSYIVMCCLEAINFMTQQLRPSESLPSESSAPEGGLP